MIPDVGNIVSLNHNFLKVWFNMCNKYFGEEVWEENFIVTEINHLEDKLIIYIECKVSKYIISILSNGEFNKTNEYKGIQVFIPPNVSKDNNIYCSYNDSIYEYFTFIPLEKGSLDNNKERTILNNFFKINNNKDIFPSVKNYKSYSLHCNKNRNLGNIKHNIISDIYCSCDGPSKENWAGGNRFYVCTICKREKLVKYLKIEDEKFINEWKCDINEFYRIIKGK